MIYIVILLTLATAAAVCLWIKEKRKFANLVNSSANKEKADEEIIKQLGNDLEQSRNQNSQSEWRIGELKNLVETNRFKMVSMYKNLVEVQKTMYSERGMIKSYFPDYFILNMPAESAGGDFYKFAFKGDYVMVACGNCGVTGINGLIKGILNTVFVSEIIERNDIATISAGKILDLVRSKYAHLAEHNTSYRRDEDIPVSFTVCIINQKLRTLSYAGAYGSMCLLRKSYPGTNRREVDVHEFRGERMNFAVSFGRRKNYDSETIELEKDDKIYIKTDGFANQRGGSNGNRFGDIYLRQMLMKHANDPMLDQMKCFKNEFDHWRGSNYRANDVLMIGLALKVKTPPMVQQPEAVFDIEPLTEE